MITAIMVAYGARIMQPEQHPCLYVPLELYVDLFPVPIFIYRLIVLTKFNAFLISTNHFSLIFGLLLSD